MRKTNSTGHLPAGVREMEGSVRTILSTPYWRKNKVRTKASAKKKGAETTKREVVMIGRLDLQKESPKQKL